jgi:hypothetical protein
MAVLLIIVAWVLLLWLILALCQAARLGEVEGQKVEPARAANEHAPVIGSKPPSAPSRGDGYASNPVLHAGGATG